MHRLRLTVLLVAIATSDAATSYAAGRVAIADEELAATVGQMLDLAEHRCRSRVLKAFGVSTNPKTIFWHQGDTATCNTHGAVAYFKTGDRKVYVCRSFLDQPPSHQFITVLHEELHVLGVREGHDPAGKDHDNIVNRKIAELCR
jgi:hypothetical protein